LCNKDTAKVCPEMHFQTV